MCTCYVSPFYWGAWCDGRRGGSPLRRRSVTERSARTIQGRGAAESARRDSVYREEHEALKRDEEQLRNTTTPSVVGERRNRLGYCYRILLRLVQHRHLVPTGALTRGVHG